MFTPKAPYQAKLEKAIDELLLDLATVNSDSEEYNTMIDQLAKLCALRDQTSRKRISSDTLVIVGGNLLGILLIVGHERANVVTSKALSFVLKPR